jgi:hypothetical protein
MPFIETIERHLGKPANKIMLPMQKGDVTETYADASLLQALTGFTPRTTIDQGVKALVDWYRNETSVDGHRAGPTPGEDVVTSDLPGHARRDQKTKHPPIPALQR